MSSVQVGPASIAWAPEDRELDVSGTLGLLSPADRERATGFRPRRLRRFILGRSLVHALAAELFPGTTGWSTTPGPCRRCGSAHAGVELHGIPALGSVSYTDGLVAAAVAPTSQVSRLGIGAERDAADAHRVEDLRRLLGASNERVLRRWTRVQAVLKADGRGLLIDPGAVWLRRGGAWIAGEQRAYVVAEVAGPPGFVLSVAWSAAAWAEDSGRSVRRTAGPAGDRWSSGYRPQPGRRR